MTARQHLMRAFRRTQVGQQVGLVAGLGCFFAMAGIVSRAAPSLPAWLVFGMLLFPILGIVVSLGGPVAYGNRAVRCPFCGAVLLALFYQGKPDSIECCPYCKAGFDDPMPVEAPDPKWKGKGEGPAEWDDELV